MIEPRIKQYRILASMITLRKFGVDDLSQLTGLLPTTVRTVIRRNRNLLVELPKKKSSKRGGRFKKYRVADNKLEELRSIVSRLYQELPQFWGDTTLEAGREMAVPLGILAAEELLFDAFPDANVEEKKAILKGVIARRDCYMRDLRQTESATAELTSTEDSKYSSPERTFGEKFLNRLAALIDFCTLELEMQESPETANVSAMNKAFARAIVHRSLDRIHPLTIRLVEAVKLKYYRITKTRTYVRNLRPPAKPSDISGSVLDVLITNYAGELFDQLKDAERVVDKLFKKLPDSLSRAVRETIATASVDGIHHFRERANSREYIAVTCPYSKVDGGFNGFQTKLKNSLGTLEIGRKVDYHGDESFEVLHRLDLALHPRVVYLFPFFMHRLRHKMWCAIPYAKHRRIGMLIHKENPLFENWDKISSSNNLETKSNVVQQNLHELIRSVQEGEGFIYATDNYLFQEILPNLIPYWRLAPQEQQVIQLHSLRKAYSNMPGEPVPQSMRVNNPISSGNAKLQVFLFDLAERENVSKNSRDDYTILSIPHGLTIPVGIGFTLHLLVHLLERNIWTYLRSIALDYLRPLARDLNEIGIELDESSHADEDIIGEQLRHRTRTG